MSYIPSPSDDLWLENCCKNRRLRDLSLKVTCAPRGGIWWYLYISMTDSSRLGMADRRSPVLCCRSFRALTESRHSGAFEAMNIAKNVFVLKYVTN